MSGSFKRNDLPKSFGSANSKHKRSNTYQDKSNTDNFRECAEKLFSKKFSFSKCKNSWKLPPPSQVFASDPWKIRHLQTLKNGLNFQKSRLNDYAIEEWSAHTAKRNPAGDVRWKLRNTINPEFLTQAWTKFYECASNYEIISDEAKSSKVINSLHLCEAPGAFIASFNHYLKLHFRELRWKWLATTLNPYHEDNSLSSMICDDRFILHTLHNWDFGRDYSGNLMDWTNSQALIHNAKLMGDIQFITADGSIDCMLKPDEQEETVAPLNFCEVITALLALSKGGTFVFKLFTIFEHSTINLVYLLTVCFEAVNIYKPSTSKEGNSEVYAICTGYLEEDLIQHYIPTITKFYGSPEFATKALFPLAYLPESYLEQVQTCTYYFYNLQCEVINDNICMFENPNQRKESQLKRYRYAFASMFLERYELAGIRKEDEIMNGFSQEEVYIHLNPRNHQGTFTERLRLIPLSQQEKMVKFYEELKILRETYDLTDSDSISWINCSIFCDSAVLKFTHGKPVEKIKSSKFVLSWVLKFYMKLTEECPDNFSINNSESMNCLTLSFTVQEPNERFDDWEKKILYFLRDSLNSLNTGETLVLRNFRVLTQFSAGVLYMLARTSFQELGFGNNSIIVLKHFKNKVEIINLLESIIKEVNSTVKHGEDSNTSILGIVPIQHLTLGMFYSCLLKYNNSFLYARTKEIVAQLSKNLKSN